MAWVAVEHDGSEYIYRSRPKRSEYGYWEDIIDLRYGDVDTGISIPVGTIKSIIGHDMTWDDEPVELKEE